MKRKTPLPVQRFTVVMEADEASGYYAFCPTLPGCYSQGETLEETKRHMVEAVQCHLEGLVKAGDPHVNTQTSQTANHRPHRPQRR